MGYEAFKPNKTLNLDIDSLPTDNKMTWEKLAEVDQVLATVRDNLFDITEGIH
jgi:hypothetical protein